MFDRERLADLFEVLRLVSDRVLDELEAGRLGEEWAEDAALMRELKRCGSPEGLEARLLSGDPALTRHLRRITAFGKLNGLVHRHR